MRNIVLDTNSLIIAISAVLHINEYEKHCIGY